MYFLFQIEHNHLGLIEVIKTKKINDLSTIVAHKKHFLILFNYQFHRNNIHLLYDAQWEIFILVKERKIKVVFLFTNIR